MFINRFGRAEVKVAGWISVTWKARVYGWETLPKVNRKKNETLSAVGWMIIRLIILSFAWKMRRFGRVGGFCIIKRMICLKRTLSTDYALN